MTISEPDTRTSTPRARSTATVTSTRSTVTTDSVHQTHPALEACDKWPLHYACRIGNLDHVQYLVEHFYLQQSEDENQTSYYVDINQADDHDATPLYLSALTGRTDICQYLLEHGAFCEDDLAARIYYVALTPELRTMLRTWRLNAATRDPFLDRIGKLYSNENNPTKKKKKIEKNGGEYDRIGDGDADDTETYSDLYTIVYDENSHGREIFLHKCILAIRCPLLLKEQSNNNHHHDEGKEEEQRLELPDLGSWSYVLEYLYTGTLETTSIDVATNVLGIARAYQLHDLEMQLKVLLDRDDYTKMTAEKRFRTNILHTVQLKQSIPKLLTNMSDHVDKHYDDSTYPDIHLKCHDRIWKLHRCIVCPVSEYLRCALTGNFREARESSLDLSAMCHEPEAVQCMVEWMYSGAFFSSHLPLMNMEWAMAILELGSALLCSGLCTYTANVAIQPTVDTVLDLYINVAKENGYSRLEEKCIEVMAYSLEELATTTPTTTKKEDNGTNGLKDNALVQLFIREVSETLQQGIIQDIPMVAEIRRAIKSSAHDDWTEEDRSRRLDLLLSMKEVALTHSSQSDRPN